jgi:hypothetical protein
MNPAQLLNPKAFAKEKAAKAKAAKRTPNYGMSSVSFFSSFTECSMLSCSHFSLCFHKPLFRRVIFDDWCLILLSPCGM